MNTINVTNTFVADFRQGYSPTLTPKLAPWMREFISRPELAIGLLKTDSPAHVLVTSEFDRNVDDLLSPLSARKIEGGLFFARKANKLPWFVSQAKKKGIGVDVASLEELKETLQLAIPTKQIIVTAIGKGSKLVELAIGNNCLLVVDNIDEIDLIESVARSLSRQARIGIRFSGFNINGQKVFSRFGFSIDDSQSILSKIIGSEWLQLELLHGHLDRYDIEERATAIRQLIQVVDQASNQGCRIEAIDIGGGILIRYLESPAEWIQFKETLVSAVKGNHPSFTFRGDGLGFVRAGKELIGQADLYPMWNDLSKERFIQAILDYQQQGIPLYKELYDRGLKLYFEPGRALLDNTGITLAEVRFRKRDTDGNLLIGLAMNRTHLRPFRAEFCSDPILISSKEKIEAGEGAYLVGCLCSESDIIFRRKLQLKFLPQPGDIFCFANTAGYLMHHLEIGTHGDLVPSNFLLNTETWNISEQIVDKRYL